jgi:hypothetical protein
MVQPSFGFSDESWGDVMAPADVIGSLSPPGVRVRLSVRPQGPDGRRRQDADGAAGHAEW